MASETNQATTTTSPSSDREHVGYIPHDAPLALAASMAFPLELPKTRDQAVSRYGRPARRVRVHITVEELE